MDPVKERFVALLSEHQMDLSERKWERFETYCRELVSWNERMNLTAITEREQVYIKHFYDSLSLSFFVDMGRIDSLADIGSGAGFPSIPLKIMFPHLRITVIDSLNKRIRFLTHLVETLGLNDVRCIHGRAEDEGRKPELRDSFDLVAARAVARLNVLAEFCLPFVKTGGMFAAMKGTDPSEELKEAAYSLEQLNGQWMDTFFFKLPVDDSNRHIVMIRKIGSTPKKYPRKAGVPLKQPLVK